MPIRLSATSIEAIHSSLDDLFDRLKIRLIGPQSVPKRIRIGVIQEYTLPGLFAAAAAEEGADPNFKDLTAALGVANSYIEAYRDIAKAKVVKEVQSFLNDAEHKGIKTDLPTVLGGKLSDIWSDVSDSVHQIVDTEANTVKNIGILEGIKQINAESNIDDPVVYFVVVRDEKLCDECKELHLMGDGHTPRLWYMSEVASGYHKKGHDSPSLNGLHPHCRCTMASIMPGYGFDAGGKIEYKRKGYDAMAVQRHLERSEEFGDLRKYTPEGLPHFHAVIRPQAVKNAAEMKAAKSPEPKDKDPWYRPVINEADPIVSQHLATCPIVMQFPKKNLYFFKQDPRFKNLGAIGTGRGSTWQEERKRHEWEVFGIPQDEVWEKRPVYGSVWVQHHHQKTENADWHTIAPAGQYGDVLGVLRPHVHDRVTVCGDDSFGCQKHDIFAMDGMAEFAKHLATHRIGPYEFIKNVLTSGKPTMASGWGDGSLRYLEAQVHGGLNFSDFAELHLSPNFDQIKPASSDLPPRYWDYKRYGDLLKDFDSYVKSYGLKYALDVYGPPSEFRKPNGYSAEEHQKLNDMYEDLQRLSVTDALELCKKHKVKLVQHTYDDTGMRTPSGQYPRKMHVLYDPANDPEDDWNVEGRIYDPETDPRWNVFGKSELRKFTPEGLPHLENVLKPLAQTNAKLYNIYGPGTEHEKYVKAMEEAPVVLAMPWDNIEFFMKDPRFKNLGAVNEELEKDPYGKRRGRGCRCGATRKDYEAKVFKIPIEEPWTKRPVYGALWIGHKTIRDPEFRQKAEEAGKYPGAAKAVFEEFHPASGYGELLAVVKPHIKKERTTYTPCDSFDASSRQVFDSSTLHGLYGVMRDFGSYNALRDYVDHGTPYRPYTYAEAQIHGGLNLSDLAEIHITPGAIDKFVAREAYYESEKAAFRDKLNAGGASLENLIGLCKKHGIKLIKHENVHPTDHTKGFTTSVIHDPAGYDDYEPTVASIDPFVEHPCTTQQQLPLTADMPGHEEDKPIAVIKPPTKTRAKPRAPRKISAKKTID